MDCLKYAHEPDGNVKNGCPWDEETCTYAAMCGYLDCLIYAHAPNDSLASSTTRGEVKNGCPWDKNTCKYAAKRGRLECLMYAIKNNCPINIKECLIFAKTEEIKKYLLSLEN